MSISIAVLLTCHNRKLKTQKCLESFKKAYYNYREYNIEFTIYLTDDGCTDGTVEVARSIFPDIKQLQIVKGDGNLYWAGGMRSCWREALKHQTQWDYYLLLNDDVELMENLFDELFSAMSHCILHYNKEGIVSGITCDTQDTTKQTYGGSVWKNRFFATTRMLAPNNTPQLCDFTNANILLVPGSVVEKIGIFHEGYHHGAADYDYSITARKHGFPVLLTSHFCGKCDHDHILYTSVAKKVISMTLKERIAYFKNPLHSSSDHLRFVSRVAPLRVPFVFLGHILNLYFPKLYYAISGHRDQ